MSLRPEISVVILIRPRSESAMALILSLLNQNLPSRDFEILVVTPFSHFSLEKQIRELEDYTETKVKFLCSYRPGPHPALNKGVEMARGSLVLFLDDLCLVEDPDLLKKHIESHRSHPELDALGGSFDLDRKAGVVAAAAFVQSHMELENARTSKNKATALGRTNISIKKALFQKGFRFTASAGEGCFQSLYLYLKDSALGFFEDLPVTDRYSPGLWTFMKTAFEEGKKASNKKTNLSPFTSFYSGVSYHSWYYSRSKGSARDWLIYSLLQFRDLFRFLGRGFADAPKGQAWLSLFTHLRLWFRQNRRGFVWNRRARDLRSFGTAVMEMLSRRLALNSAPVSSQELNSLK